MCDICENLGGASQSRRQFFGLMGGVAASVVGGSAIATAGPASAVGPVKLVIGDLLQAGAHGAGLRAALHPSIASKYGLAIEARQYSAGANLVQALASGDIVAGVCGCTPAIMARAQGIKLKIVANSNREGSSLIGRKDIAGPADLNGKIVATPNIASVQEAILQQYEKRLGIKTKRAYVKATDMPIMLRNGEIDAYIVWETTATAGLAVSTGKVLAVSKDIAPNHECCSLIINEDFLVKQPEKAKQLISAFAEGRRLISSDANALAKIVSEADGVSPEIARQALRNVSFTSAINNTQELVQLTELLISLGTIERGKVADTANFVKQLVDNSIIASL